MGGTPLYLKVLLRGLFSGPAADAGLRQVLEREADSLGEAALHARLSSLDPATAARLDHRDRRRVIRALEVIERTGKPLSALQLEHGQPAPESVRVFALEPPRAIRASIASIAACCGSSRRDWSTKCAALLSGPRPLSDTAAQAIGYREVIAMLAGDASLDQTIDRVQARTRQFAKRQATWFRGLRRFNPCPYYLTRLRRPSPYAWRESSKTSRSAIIPRAKTHTAATTRRRARSPQSHLEVVRSSGSIGPNSMVVTFRFVSNSITR